MSETGPIPPTGSTPPSTPIPTTASLGYAGPEPDKDSKTMAMLAHLLAIVLGVIGPLIIWLIKKDQSPFVNDQGKEALNFQLMVLIGWVVCYIIALATCVGFILLPALFITNLIFCIMAAMKANAGVAYRYPINIRFIK